MSSTADVVFLEDQTETADLHDLDVSDPQNPYLVVPGWVQSTHESFPWHEHRHYNCANCYANCINHRDSKPAEFDLCGPCVARVAQKMHESLPKEFDNSNAVRLLQSL